MIYILGLMMSLHRVWQHSKNF